MADTVIVRCSYCGEKIGEITFVPGSQTVGCPQCKGVTKVTISESGSVRTERHVHPSRA
jgi:phage FluMu protein Com